MAQHVDRDDIEKMGVGALVHTMLVEFDKNLCDDVVDGAFMQSSAYFWASERLNVLFRDVAPDNW